MTKALYTWPALALFALQACANMESTDDAADSTLSATESESPDSNATPSVPNDTKLQQDMTEVLQRSPGARQISIDEIELESGLIMKLSSSVSSDQAPTGAEVNVQDFFCPFGFVCVFSNADFGGFSLRRDRCGQEWNLGGIAFPGGGLWNDKISSIINNQSANPNRTAFFYDFVGSGTWMRVLSLGQGRFLRNLAFDTAEGGGPVNDRIDGMHICGLAPSPWTPNAP